MQDLKRSVNNLDAKLSSWMDKYGIVLLRYSLAVIFIWFGALKPLGISPAAELVAKTIPPFVAPEFFIPFLGWWEIVIGLCFLFKPLIRAGILLLFLQMAGAMSPLVLLPEECYTHFPYGLTLEGQYIVKNLLVMSAALVIGGKLIVNQTKSGDV